MATEDAVSETRHGATGDGAAEAPILGAKRARTMRLAAGSLFGAALFMAYGGIVKRLVGADLEVALADGELAGHFEVLRRIRRWSSPICPR